MGSASWRSSCALVAAVLLIATGAMVILLGALLARDVLLVNREMVSFGLGIRSRLGAALASALGFRPTSDVAEVLLAALAVSAVTLGVGILIGRWAAR